MTDIRGLDPEAAAMQQDQDDKAATLKPRVDITTDRTGEEAGNGFSSRRARLWVLHPREGTKRSHQLEVELDNTGHFKVCILSPLGEAFTSTQIHEGYLYEQPAITPEQALEEDR